MFALHPSFLTAVLQISCAFLVFSIGSDALQLPPVRTVASPNALITEAPAQELLERNIAKRDINPCTQWTVLGAAGLGCSGTETCLFTSLGGYYWEYCGAVGAPRVFATYCYDYPTTWNGVSPIDVAYCSRTAPYCGEFQFVISGNTFYNLGCSTVPYHLTVVTTPGATFPGGSSTSPRPPSTTTIPPPSSTPTTTTIPTSTPVTTTTTTPSPSTSTTIISSSSTTLIITTTPTTSVITPTTSSSAATSTSTLPSITSTPITTSTIPQSETTTSSSSSSTSPLPCSDPAWEPTPQNWFDADVDHELLAWWTNTTDQRGSYGFVDWLARSFGDLSHSQECGLGQSCAAPDCQAFQASGAPRWAYFVHVSLNEMNNLFNSMKDGMTDAETDLSLIVSDMAYNFFPWNNPSTNLGSALPFIIWVISSILGFIPFIGPVLRVEGATAGTILQAVTSSAQSLVQAGFSELSTGGSDPESHQLGTIQALGVLIENTTVTMRDELGNWSTTLFNGGPDTSGKTIKEYMGGGRFTLAYNIQQSFMDSFFLQIWVSRLVNEQWQDTMNVPSKTFVMCTNATAACTETSKYTEGNRTCCLYSIDNNANYVPPPAIDVLGNSTYNITPSDITASSLHSYMAQGLNYDVTKVGSTIEESISANDSNSFLDQGVRFQGVWTLPVCDVGLNGDWVANTSLGLMPCCCGPNCSETIQFWNNTGILNLSGLHNKCKTQCSTCPTSAAHGHLRVLGLNVADSVYLMSFFYVGILFWISL